MPSVWIEKRPTKAGGVRYRVEFALGGRRSRGRYAGSFKTKAEAAARRNWVAGELAALRVPDLRLLSNEAPTALTVTVAAERWLASRIDVGEATKIRNDVEVKRIGRLLGNRRVDEVEPADAAAFVVALSEHGYKRGTIRKTLQTLAMMFDHAGIQPNPARDRVLVKLPREDAEEICPPTAAHVIAVFRRLPAVHRLPLLWLDWSGARVASVDLTLVGDYDEPRRRVRLRKAATKTAKGLWVELPPVLAEAIEATLPHRRFRDLRPACSRTPVRTRSAPPSPRRARRRASRRSALTTSATRASHS